MRIGIGLNEWAQALPKDFERACIELGYEYQIIDFTNLKHVEVTHLAPALLYLKPDAHKLYKSLEYSGVMVLNKVGAIDIADDKAQTFRTLQLENIPQLETQIVPLELSELRRHFIEGGTVYKRTHGGQGRWVRLATYESDIESIYQEFLEEGPGEIIVQPLIEEAIGESVRVIVNGSDILASAIRRSTEDFRSNISLGGSQSKYKLSKFEEEIALKSASTLGLKHAGVDLILSKEGPCVLEVNACPDFTSMKEITSIDIAKRVIENLVTTTSP